MTSSFQYGETEKVAGQAALSYVDKNIERQRFSLMVGVPTGLRMAQNSGRSLALCWSFPQAQDRCLVTCFRLSSSAFQV